MCSSHAHKRKHHRLVRTPCGLVGVAGHRPPARPPVPPLTALATDLRQLPVDASQMHGVAGPAHDLADAIDKVVNVWPAMFKAATEADATGVQFLAAWEGLSVEQQARIKTFAEAGAWKSIALGLDTITKISAQKISEKIAEMAREDNSSASEPTDEVRNRAIAAEPVAEPVAAAAAEPTDEVRKRAKKA